MNPFEMNPFSQIKNGQSLYPMDRPEIPRSALATQDQPSEDQTMNKYSAMPVDDMILMEVAKMVADRKDASKTWRDQKRQIWDKCWEHYRQVYDATGKEAWQSKIFYPDTPKVVEIITAALSASILAPELPAEWQVNVKELEEQVRAHNDLMKSDLKKSGFKSNFTDHLRALTILGTSVGKVGYVIEKDIVMTKQRQRPGMMERLMASVMGTDVEERSDLYETKEMLVKDWATVEYRDLYKIYPEPYTTEISKKHWIIEESKITNKELVELANSQDPIQQIKNVTYDVLNGGNKRVDEDPETQIRRMALNQQSTSLTFFDPDQPHVLDEYWGPVPMWMVYPEKRNDEESKYSMVNAWIWVIDGNHVVRCQLNPYRDAEPPYFKDSYIRVPGDWYGIGPAELMLWLQIAKNEAINTKTDNVNLLLNIVMAVLKDKVDPEDWKRLKSEPGGLWLFSNLDDIRKGIMPVQWPNLIKDIYLTIQELDRAIQEVTGANSATSGVGGGEDQAAAGTFRGQLLNEQSSGKRFMLAARNIESGGLTSCLLKVNQRIYQFKSYQSAESILGPKRGQTFEFIAPEQMEKVANLVPLGVMTMETKGVKLAQMRDFQTQYQGRPWLKEFDLARRQWIEMGYSDPDSVIFSEDEMKQFNQMRQQMISQMGGGGSPPIPGQAPSEPIAGDMPGPTDGLAPMSMPARGPGASPIDSLGRPAA